MDQTNQEIVDDVIKTEAGEELTRTVLENFLYRVYKLQENGWSSTDLSLELLDMKPKMWDGTIGHDPDGFRQELLDRRREAWEIGTTLTKLLWNIPPAPLEAA